MKETSIKRLKDWEVVHLIVAFIISVILLMVGGCLAVLTYIECPAGQVHIKHSHKCIDEGIFASLKDGELVEPYRKAAIGILLIVIAYWGGIVFVYRNHK